MRFVNSKGSIYFLTYVGREDGVVGARTAAEHRLIGGAAEVRRVIVRGTRGATAPDVVHVDLVGRAVDVLGTVNRTAVPRSVPTRARQYCNVLYCILSAAKHSYTKKKTIKNTDRHAELKD